MLSRSAALTPESEPSTPENDPAGEVWSSRSYPIEEHMGLQRITWRIERLGWLALAGLVAAALLGLLGSGVLSTAIATGADGRLEVTYGRFERSGASTGMQVLLGASAQDRVVLRLNAAFMEAFTIESLHPRPAEERSGRDGAEMVFRVTDGAPLRLYFSLRPARIGMVKSEVAVAEGPPARFTQLVYP